MKSEPKNLRIVGNHHVAYSVGAILALNDRELYGEFQTTDEAVEWAHKLNKKHGMIVGEK